MFFTQIAHAVPERVHKNIDAPPTTVHLFDLGPGQSVTFETSNSYIDPVLHIVRKSTTTSTWSHVSYNFGAVGAEVTLTYTNTSNVTTYNYALIMRTKLNEGAIGFTSLIKNGQYLGGVIYSGQTLPATDLALSWGDVAHVTPLPGGE